MSYTYMYMYIQNMRTDTLYVYAAVQQATEPGFPASAPMLASMILSYKLATISCHSGLFLGAQLGGGLSPSIAAPSQTPYIKDSENLIAKVASWATQVGVMPRLTII